MNTLRINLTAARPHVSNVRPPPCCPSLAPRSTGATVGRQLRTWILARSLALSLLLSVSAASRSVDAQPAPSGTTVPAGKADASSAASSKSAPASPTTKPATAAPAKPGTATKRARPTAREIQETTARVSRRFEDGRQAGLKNDWTKAYQAFLDAWNLMQLPQIALNLGRAELMTGRFREAVPHLRYCIEHSNPKNRDEALEISLANDWLAEAQKKAVKLVVSVDLAGAHVVVDDQPEGIAPLSAPILVNPGSHIVQAWLGDRRAQKGVVTDTGAVLTVDLVLDPKPPPPPGLFESWPLDRTMVRVGIAGSLASLTIGAVTGALALDKQSAADACPYELRPRWSQQCWERREAERTPLAIASAIGFGASGAFLLAAGASLLLGSSSRGEKEPSSLVVAPFAAPSHGGLVITGRF